MTVINLTLCQMAGGSTMISVKDSFQTPATSKHHQKVRHPTYYAIGWQTSFKRRHGQRQRRRRLEGTERWVFEKTVRIPREKRVSSKKSAWIGSGWIFDPLPVQILALAYVRPCTNYVLLSRSFVAVRVSSWLLIPSSPWTGKVAGCGSCPRGDSSRRSVPAFSGRMRAFRRCYCQLQRHLRLSTSMSQRWLVHVNLWWYLYVGIASALLISYHRWCIDSAMMTLFILNVCLTRAHSQLCMLHWNLEWSYRLC